MVCTDSKNIMIKTVRGFISSKYGGSGKEIMKLIGRIITCPITIKIIYQQLPFIVLFLEDLPWTTLTQFFINTEFLGLV
jgi:hypothetical protein